MDRKFRLLHIMPFLSLISFNYLKDKYGIFTVAVLSSSNFDCLINIKLVFNEKKIRNKFNYEKNNY